jgi:cytochrome b involved in lipid metabolism
MGWLRAVRGNTSGVEPEPTRSMVETKGDHLLDKQSTSHIEELRMTADSCPQEVQSLPFAPEDTPDSELPFLSAAQITRTCRKQDGDRVGPLYLVVDGIVYNCTQFVHDHPGGPRVIEAFRGQDCSWQFWRFHSKKNMEEWGRRLRVARTNGVENKWKERPRFVGLRKLGGFSEQDW